MKCRSSFFILYIILKILFFSVVSSCKSNHALAPANEMCPALDSLLISADMDFLPCKGNFIGMEQTDSDFESNIHIPASVRNVLVYDTGAVPLFMTTLYLGKDSLYAYEQYIGTIQKLMACKPDFKLGDKKKYEKLDARLYQVLIKDDKIIYIEFTNHEPGEYGISLLVTIDPESPEYNRK